MRQIWDTGSGELLHVLEGHENVVYEVCFNNPYGDKVVTTSFDKTAKMWSVETVQLASLPPLPNLRIVSALHTNTCH